MNGKFKNLKSLFVLAISLVLLSHCSSVEEIPVDCEDENNSNCSADSIKFKKENLGVGGIAGITGGIFLLANGVNNDNGADKKEEKKEPGGSNNDPLLPINQKVMRFDADQEGQTLLLESSNLLSVYEPATTISAIINWQFPDNEDTGTIYLGGIFGDWVPETPFSLIQEGFPVIGETRTESFSFVTPVVPGVYLLRLILNSSTSHPASFRDLQHYKFDFIFEVEGHESSSLNSDWRYFGRIDGAREYREAMNAHVIAIENDNVHNETFGKSETVQANLKWQFSYLENLNAWYFCSIFGSWNQEQEIFPVYGNLASPITTPPIGESQNTSFSFNTPDTIGVYSLRLICNSSSVFPASFSNATHYFIDSVFTVKDSSLPLGGLTLHYPFSGNANDHSGNGSDGQVDGATLSEDRHGIAESAYIFEGGEHPFSQSILLSGIETLGGLDHFTMSVWFNAFEFSSESCVTTFMSDTFGQFLLGPNSRVDNKISFRVNIDGGSFTNHEILSNNPISLNQWYHVVVTYDGSELKMFLDNQLQEDSISISGTVNSHEHYKGVYIGRESRNQTNFNSPAGYTGFVGKIDDFRIYNRALSAAEVKELYEE
ncbi:MAG: LamG domain-containing protein [SAR324 cluster bacterium]|nr:LamG domain-containing protein [SAR324 cluster bacterium]